MRWILSLLLVSLLAGCFGPEEEVQDDPPLFGTCPHWVAGSAVIELDGTGSLLIDPLGPDNQTDLVWQDRPLDMYLLEMHATGPLQVRAHHADSGERRLMIHQEREGSPEAKLVLHLEDESAEAHVFLAGTEEDSSPDPGRLRLQVDGLDQNATLSVTATPYYRVCGVP